MVAAAIALDVIFELAAGDVPDFRGAGSAGGYPYAYDACILRYFAAIAVGMWLAIDDSGWRAAGSWSSRSRCPASAYIAVAGTDPAAFPFFVHGFTLATNFAVVPWAATMLLAALYLWPARGVPGTGWLERLGVASYEAFLVQVVWLGVLTDRGLVPFIVAALASGLLGWALHRALTTTAVGPLARLEGGMSDADLSGSPFETIDPRFDAMINPSAKLERLATGCRWAEGPGLFPGRPLPRLVRHPQRPHAALRRDRRPGQRLPPAVRQHQRQHRRPAGPAGHLRAWRPPRHAAPSSTARITMLADKLQRQAAQLAQRRRRQVGRHRSGSPTRPTASTRLRGRQRRSARSAAATSTASIPATGEVDAVVADDFVQAQRPRLLARREASSTSPTPAAPTAPTARATSASSTSATSGKLTDGRVFADLRRRPVRRLPLRRAPAASGPGAATASIASTPTAR